MCMDFVHKVQLEDYPDISISFLGLNLSSFITFSLLAYYLLHSLFNLPYFLFLLGRPSSAVDFKGQGM